MAHYISEREQRKVQRDRKKEEMEKERERLMRNIEMREMTEPRSIDDCREELIRIRRERQEMRRQHEMDRQRYEDQSRAHEQIERRQYDDERRTLELERNRYGEEKTNMEKERPFTHREERRRFEEIERRREDERMIQERQKLEDERVRLEEERNRLEQIEKRRYEERMNYKEERKRREEIEKRREEEEEMILIQSILDRQTQEKVQKKKDRIYLPGGKETTAVKTFIERREQEDIDDVFEEENKEKDKKEMTLRRQSETALQQLKKRNTSLEKELKQLNKTWTPSGVLTLHKDFYESTMREDSEEDTEREWTTVDQYHNQGYETDDEIDRLGDNIEKLKIKEMRLLQDMERKRNIKKEREIQRRQEAEAHRRRQEKHKVLEQLKKEQLRMLEELKKHEETINALSSTESESDGELSRPMKDDHEHKRPYLPRDQYKGVHNFEGQKFTLPRLPNLTEETFEEWKLEIEVMMDSNLYQPDALLHAVRNSLSRASKSIRSVLQTIDTKASTRDILDKLENIYGDRRSGESHLADFYKARQKPTENVAEWGVRLENIILKAVKKGQVNKEQTDQMLRKRFWKYLNDDKLKLSTRLFFETSKSFEELMKKIRIEENEMYNDSDSSRTSGKKKSEKRNTGEDTSVMNELLERMKNVEKELEKSTERSRGRERYRQGYRGRGGYRRYEREDSDWRNRHGNISYEYDDNGNRDWRNQNRDASYNYRDSDRDRWRNITDNTKSIIP